MTWTSNTVGQNVTNMTIAWDISLLQVPPVRTLPDGTISVDLNRMERGRYYDATYRGSPVLVRTLDGESVATYRVKHPNRLQRWLRSRWISR